MTLPLKDADGNAVTCATIDIAGNPDDFNPPVVTKDATGALVWSQGAAAGQLLNWREPIEENYASGLAGGDAYWRFFVNDANTTGGEFKEISVGGTKYNMMCIEPTFDIVTMLGEEQVDVDAAGLVAYINDHSGEVLPHVTLELLAGTNTDEQMIYAGDIGAQTLVFKPELSGYEWEAYMQDYYDNVPETFMLTFNVQPVEFDSMSYNPTTELFDLVNPVVGDAVEVTYSCTYNDTLHQEVRVNYATIAGGAAQDMFPEVIQNGVQFTLQGGKKWTLCVSDIALDPALGTFDGVGYDGVEGDKLGITFKPRFYV